MPSTFNRHPASYRDPSGFVFYKNGILFRQVNTVFKKDFDHFINSGFAPFLVKSGSLIPFEEIKENYTSAKEWYTTLIPQPLEFISFPYEWSFDMLKDAALLTLSIAKEAINYGMMLKDATPYNIQFEKGRPIFIDTLSFEVLDATTPWIAYHQFCQTFLVPLSLMHYLKMPVQQLMLSYPEGIPLSNAEKLLPYRSKFNLNTYLHVHLNAKYTNRPIKQGGIKALFNEGKLKNILSSLESTVHSYKLNYKAVWTGYYEEAQQRPEYIDHKKEVIENWLSDLPQIKKAIDVGANEGLFTKILAAKKIFTISADSDHFSVNALYKSVKENGEENIHPLILDLANPSPAIGVNNQERASFIERVKTDLVLALAVLHHLCIGRNISFEDVAFFFAQLGKHLIVEFVPKEDEKVAYMLQQKKDIYVWYNEELFLNSFSAYYKIINRQQVNGSKRILFLMQQNED